MSNQGYYRFPDVRGDVVVFVSEDDLWQVPLTGGIARRLTANLSEVSSPKISPDGKWVAYAAAEEGYREIYLMDADGGEQKRLTFFGTMSTPLGWSQNGEYIYIASDYLQPFDTSIFQLSKNGGEPVKLPVGHANQISFNKKGCVIGRHTRDTARWKRYRGGTAGELWVDKKGAGSFTRLLDLHSNIINPMWIGERVYFISDHEGIANIYSCNLQGKNIKRHTDHDEFYVRNAGSDGKTIVYHAGADLFALDIAKGKGRKIDVAYHSPQTQANRKFIAAEEYLQAYDLNPAGTHTAAAVRGKAVTLAHWSGPVTQWGQKDGVHYRLPTWLFDNKHLVVTTDEKEGEDRLLLINSETATQQLLDLEIGRVHGIFPAPKSMQVIVTNHRNEVVLVDCDKAKMKVLDRGDYSRTETVSWSPDNKWITYDFATSLEIAIIKAANIRTGKRHAVTAPVKTDFSPVFSPDGKYIFFIGDRTFFPVYDSLQFELSFIKSAKLYAVPLTRDIGSPFIAPAKSPAGDEKAGEEKNSDEQKKQKEKQEDINVEIDFTDIHKRLIEFPISAGMYLSLQAFKDKVLFMEYPRDGIKKDDSNWFTPPKPRNILNVYDFEKQEQETLIKNISSYKLSLRGSNMIVRKGGQLSVYKTGEKPKENIKKKYSLAGGAIDMGRIKISICPRLEWRQMYREAWLLQREHFWTENMSGVDWGLVYERYLPLLERVGSRAEFSDLVWEMQGELGTSHCYEIGGDYRAGRHYPLGKLGCVYRLADNGSYYVFDKIYYGDASDSREVSPLSAAGVNVDEGDHLLAINGTEVNRDVHPRELLVNLGGQEVTLTVRKKNAKKSRNVVVKTLLTEAPLFYRSWVERNREYVHKKSNGKIGYVHIPDMGPNGFAEFHRYYLTECLYDALVVDARYNRGGHVSELLLEKLNRRQVAYSQARWSKDPETYPRSSVAGPIVALTNQFAGSDGDIFSHAFKLMKIGKLIGKRTWGGVIGINGQYSLVDGSVVTQPEYSFWFKDVGWKVENYGTDPDIEVDIQPQDYVNERDTQLDKAVTLLLEEMKANPVKKPDFDKRPNLSLPKLPGKRKK